MTSIKAEEYPMMRFLEAVPPLPLFVVSLLYVFFVLKLGPHLMKNREPYKLTAMLAFYDISQIVVNAYMVFKGTKVSLAIGFYCNIIEDIEQVAAATNLQHEFFLLKCYDLLETMFFVLRKKQNQINFLHVYHHFSMFSLSWIIGKYFPIYNGWPVGPFLVCGICNLCVHVIMYVYYLFSSLNICNAKDAWWKKYITLIQVAQLVFILCVGWFASSDEKCGYPKYLLRFALTNLAVIIYLFIRYFQASFVKSNIKPKEI